MNKKKITWQQYAELNDFDFEETYFTCCSFL